MAAPKHNPDTFIAKAESRAFNSLIDEFERAIRSRMHKRMKDGELIDWWKETNEPTLQAQFDTLCAKPTKTVADMLNIATLVALLLNFQDSGSLPPGP